MHEMKLFTRKHPVAVIPSALGSCLWSRNADNSSRHPREHREIMLHIHEHVS